MSRLLISDYPSALEFLLGRINFERTVAVPYHTGAFKLDRMRRLLSLVGDPHLGLAAVHIAGTKGKGSTAAMIAGVLQAAGMRTGLYTSPHLAAIEERMAIDGAPCSREEFATLAAELEEAVEKLPLFGTAKETGGPTFFEVTTAMAFLHFARRKVDCAVLEVGLGGRLDSTNVCQPKVTIITSISFDHTRQLGSTLAAIAGEKAGIIKPGVPVISGVVKDEPREVIRRVAREQGAPLFERGKEFDFVTGPAGIDCQALDYCEPDDERGPGYAVRGVRLGMFGAHQAANAAVAICAVRRLVEQGWAIDEAALRSGLASAKVPARIELISDRPVVILDVAHNVASIEALLGVLADRFRPRRRILIFASSKDKDTAGMLRLLLPRFDEVVLTRYIENPRAVEIDQLQQLAEKALGADSSNGDAQPAIHAAATPGEAWRIARGLAGSDDLICISGSFFLAAELRPVVQLATLGSAR
ncbi:MAG: bifunctional folylpolyglutamate synthase/dihydrofolate synthase [Planctomycetaceae bacterium]|nr:bifunctional folylpolyglutamate synthase/dihydrofolate synthase [Planctomycetaceae bacterium]